MLLQTALFPRALSHPVVDAQEWDASLYNKTGNTLGFKSEEVRNRQFVPHPQRGLPANEDQIQSLSSGLTLADRLGRA